MPMPSYVTAGYIYWCMSFMYLVFVYIALSLFYHLKFFC